VTKKRMRSTNSRGLTEEDSAEEGNSDVEPDSKPTMGGPNKKQRSDEA